MPVRYTPPRPDDLLPVKGVSLGTAPAKIKNWQRDDLLLAAFDAGAVAAGVFTQNRFAAAPVAVCRRHLAGSGRGPRARRQCGKRQRRHRRGRHCRRRADVRGRGVDSRLRAAAGSSVFDRRHHGAAARRQDRRRVARCASRARERRMVRRGVGDHDDRHRAERRVAPNRRSTARRSPSPGLQRAPG